MNDNDDELIRLMKLTFPEHMLHLIASYVTQFRTERRWKRSVLPELLRNRPVLKVFYPHVNPNRFFEREWFDKLMFHYAEREWQLDFGSRCEIEYRYHKEKQANWFWIRRLNFYPVRSWEETVMMWRHHWNLFQQLKVEGET